VNDLKSALCVLLAMLLISAALIAAVSTLASS
jgi:hypothetical protein